MIDNGHKRKHFGFADLHLYPEERLLLRGDQRIPITPRVMDLLIVLVKNSGEIVTKEALLKSVWADSFVEEGNINRTVSTLRKKLGRQPNGGDFIETVPTLGYRFVAPVQELSGDDMIPPEIKRGGKRAYWVGVATVFLAAFLFTSLFYFWRSKKEVIDGDGLVDLTNNLAEDDVPSWSPDGTKIAFTSTRDGSGDIYVMNSDGSNASRLTNTPSRDSSAVWSPDGSKMVFDSERDGNRELYIMNADGTDQTRLTFNSASDVGPVSFSPDGRQIAFARNASNAGLESFSYDIYVMNLDGKGERRLTIDPRFDAEPIWSPDGANILFISDRSGNFDIYSIDAAGGAEVNLTNSPMHEGAPSFTPDGKQIFFVGILLSQPDLNQIYLMDSDGSNRRQITSFTYRVNRIAYSAKLQRFALSARKNGNFDIYSMGASGLPFK